MSSEQTFSNADLRSTAQDYKRDAAHKHKWALGAVDGTGRAQGKPRPQRVSENEYIFRRRAEKGEVASYAQAAKVARKHDMLDGAAITDDSSGSNSDEYDETPSPPVDAGVTYSFDAVRSPTKGSQILNVALAKAVEKFEERETVKLVKSEYELLDSDGETMAPSPMKPEKKRKGKKAESAVVVGEDEDYEFV
ncbi:uncharacterized protein MYCFIDRAFT_71161 [Pseudocercospora fijiensis CIRAD86]|uniref:Uncharacterized protein n=1 Tax=Pseudocercospora fijiensis (strain CIRAD86) TaxID=383855 RepID=M3AHF5_PSEFD|nr:uncharacterized protein MYCFIDRAFT_71161 [Pseudocercospora fijiensis CIRAD86]EME76937.1 hypothetical protein MYCFIDRAFT_71161 [Pseudocercospora fijiensis CIRAD86]